MTRSLLRTILAAALCAAGASGCTLTPRGSAPFHDHDTFRSEYRLP